MGKKIKSKIGKPRVIIMSGYGLNCEEETKYAFDWAGGRADIVHLNDLIAKPKMLKKYDVLAFPGGFAYGDDTGSGKAYANKFKNHLMKELREFLARDTLVIGICNGFQIVTNLGILPGGLTFNKGGKYIDRWVDLKVKGKSPWLAGIEKISLPIAHGEGHYVISPAESPEGKITSYGAGKKMHRAGQIAFTYEKGEVCRFQNLESNPNGSDFGIAGVLAYNGRVLGMMPHPERAMFSHQNPMWFLNKSNRKRGLPADEAGQGLQIFKNAIKYFHGRA